MKFILKLLQGNCFSLTTFACVTALCLVWISPVPAYVACMRWMSADRWTWAPLCVFVSFESGFSEQNDWQLICNKNKTQSTDNMHPSSPTPLPSLPSHFLSVLLPYRSPSQRLQLSHLHPSPHPSSPVVRSSSPSNMRPPLRKWTAGLLFHVFMRINSTHAQTHTLYQRNRSHTSSPLSLVSLLSSFKREMKKASTTLREPTFTDFFFFSPPSHSHIPPALPPRVSLSLSPRRQSWMWKTERVTPSPQSPAKTRSRRGHLQLRLADPPAQLAFVWPSPPVVRAAAAEAEVWVALALLAAALREQEKAPCSSAPDRLVLSSRASWGHGSRALTATSSTECPSRYVSSALPPCFVCSSFLSEDKLLFGFIYFFVLFCCSSSLLIIPRKSLCWRIMSVACGGKRVFFVTFKIRILTCYFSNSPSM